MHNPIWFAATLIAVFLLWTIVGALVAVGIVLSGRPNGLNIVGPLLSGPLGWYWLGLRFWRAVLLGFALVGVVFWAGYQTALWLH